MWEDNITGTYDLAVGPQSDGTSIAPTAAEMPQPVDAGGGFAGTYGKDILDIFKFGVGVYSQDKQRSDLLDYKRFEATQAGLWRQGQPALFARNAQGGNGNVLVLFAIVIGAVVLLQEKG
jgi:hypothetical protein